MNLYRVVETTTGEVKVDAVSYESALRYMQKNRLRKDEYSIDLYMPTRRAVSLSKAKTIAKNPEAFTTQELDDALTTIVEDDRLSETQVTNLQNKIDPVLRARLGK